MNAKAGLRKRKKREKGSYDKSAAALPPLKAGDGVHVRKNPTSNGRWEKAEVQGQEGIRSYRVQMEDGSSFVRNRRHIRASKEFHAQPQEQIPETPIIPAQPPHEQVVNEPAEPPYDETERQEPAVVPIRSTSPPKKSKLPIRLPVRRSVRGLSHDSTVTQSGRIVKGTKQQDFFHKISFDYFIPIQLLQVVLS